MCSLSPGLGCSKTSVWEIILSVHVLVASARARSSSSPGSNSVLSAWPRLSPVYWSRITATLSYAIFFNFFFLSKSFYCRKKTETRCPNTDTSDVTLLFNRFANVNLNVNLNSMYFLFFFFYLNSTVDELTGIHSQAR